MRTPDRWRPNPASATITAMEVAPRCADDVPALYRSILLLVQQLERQDRRREAATLRERALSAYAASWDEAHRQQLLRLEHRLRRTLASDGRSARRWLRLP